MFHDLKLDSISCIVAVNVFSLRNHKQVMIYCRLKAKSLTLFLSLLCFANTILAQNFTQDEIKAAYIFSFAKYVTWKQESQIKQFHIAILASDKQYDVFKNICAGRQLKNAPIVLSRITDTKDIPQAQIVFLGNEYCSSLQSLRKQIKTNTLLVSDNCDNNEAIMINFTDSDPEKKFELNIKNILFANLEVSRKIVTLGGGEEANWQELYTKTDNELENAKRTLNEQKEEIRKQQKILYEKAELIKQKEKVIIKQESDIQKKRDEINEQEAILNNQKSKIEEQKAVLNDQLEKIEAQQLILYLFLLVLVMIAGLAFFIFRSYKIKKKANQQLEAKNKEINKQKNEIEKQAKELELTNIQLEKLSIVASKTDNAVVIANSDGELEWVNEGFKRMHGFSLDEFKNAIGSNVFTASSNPDIRKAIQDSIDNKKSVVYTAKSKTKWGNEIWVQTTLTPILDENDKLSKLVAIDADVTQIKLQEERIRQQKEIIEIEKDKSEKLLLNILPEMVANDLKRTGKTLPEVFENVTVYFSDVVGFTKMSTKMNPQLLIAELNDIFTVFDNIIENNECERIKTIGDAYLMVCGMPKENPNHAYNVVKSSIEIIKYLQKRNKTSEITWEIRIGIHTGKVVGGVVGIKKYIYDVFGDTINTASRMESNSKPMHINVSETTYNIVKNDFPFVKRELMEIKGKGTMNMYFLSNEVTGIVEK